MIQVTCIISKYSKTFSKVMNLNEYELMNQTYFEWYEFDVYIVRILIPTCTYESTL